MPALPERVVMVLGRVVTVLPVLGRVRVTSPLVLGRVAVVPPMLERVTVVVEVAGRAVTVLGREVVVLPVAGRAVTTLPERVAVFVLPVLGRLVPTVRWVEVVAWRCTDVAAELLGRLGAVRMLL